MVLVGICRLCELDFGESFSAEPSGLSGADPGEPGADPGEPGIDPGESGADPGDELKCNFCRKFSKKFCGSFSGMFGAVGAAFGIVSCGFNGDSCKSSGFVEGKLRGGFGCWLPGALSGAFSNPPLKGLIYGSGPVAGFPFVVPRS